MSRDEQCCQEWMTKLENKTIELASVSSREALLKRELESLTVTCARAEARATGLEEEKKDWQVERQQLEAEVERVRNEECEVRSALEREKAEHQRTRVHLELRCESLQKQRQEALLGDGLSVGMPAGGSSLARFQLESCQLKVAQLEKELELQKSAQQQVQSLLNRISELEAELRLAFGDCRAAEEKAKKTEKVQKDLEATRDMLTVAKDQLSTANSKLALNISSYSTIQRLREELAGFIMETEMIHEELTALGVVPTSPRISGRVTGSRELLSSEWSMVKSFIRQAKSDNARLEAETARLAGEQECSIAQIKAMEAGAQLKEQQGKTDAIVKAPPPPPSSSPSSDVVELTSDSEASAREDPTVAALREKDAIIAANAGELSRLTEVLKEKERQLEGMRVEQAATKMVRKRRSDESSPEREGDEVSQPMAKRYKATIERLSEINRLHEEIRKLNARDQPSDEASHRLTEAVVERDGAVRELREFKIEMQEHLRGFASSVESLTGWRVNPLPDGHRWHLRLKEEPTQQPLSIEVNQKVEHGQYEIVSSSRRLPDEAVTWLVDLDDMPEMLAALVLLRGSQIMDVS